MSPLHPQDVPMCKYTCASTPVLHKHIKASEATTANFLDILRRVERLRRRGVARPDILTPVSSSSIAGCSCRHIQISCMIAATSPNAATPAACRRMGPRRRWPVDNLYCITFRVLSGVKHGRTPRARRNFLPHERAREGPAPTPSTRTHNLNLSERRQVLGHDRLEGAAPRSPAQRHAPQRTM